jgi:hypothetical protein
MIFEHIYEFYTGIYRKKFFHLFFHWSWQIRNMVYYLSLFIINHKIRNMDLPKINKIKIENSQKIDPNKQMEIVINIFMFILFF